MTTLLFLRQTFAEWRPVCVVIRRTRLGLWLTSIGLGAVGIGGLADQTLLPTLAVAVALTATVTAALALAGPRTARAAAMTLRHPASPLAVAAGRWLAVAALASLVTLGAGVGAAWQVQLGWREGVDAAVAASWVALPVAICGLVLTAACWRRSEP